MDTNKVLEVIKSKKVTVLMATLFALAVLVGTFNVGLMVGYRKAKFSYAWGENYHRNFAGPRGGFVRDFGREMNGGDYIGGHGTFGQIIDIRDQQIVVRGKDNSEQVIAVTSDTDIQRFKDSIQMSDLKVDEPIVVIGEPNDQGQIEAKFIRVMPTPSRLPIRR